MKFINLSLVIFLVFPFWGCDNSFNPFEEGKVSYSIYGYMNIYEEVNYIRVKDLNKTLDETGEEIDAEVLLENLDNGRTQILQDTVVEFDGVKTHNFRTTMNIKPDTDYRVTVERSDGQTASITATTPYISETTIEPTSANCTTQVNINFEPIRSKLGLDMEVGFYFNNVLLWTRVNNILIETENNVDLYFTPSKFINEVIDREEEVFCEDLSDDIFEVRYIHYGPGIFEETLSDTLAISGGVGRFGAFYEDSFSIRIDTTNLCPPICRP